MADEDSADIVEDVLQGSSADIVDTGSDDAPDEMNLPDLDIGIEAEPEDVGNESPDESKDGLEDKPEFSWNREKQESDQEAANDRKRLARAEHTIEELKAALAGSPTKDLDAAMEALANLTPPSPVNEFEDDDDKRFKAEEKAYKAERKRILDEAKGFSAKLVEAKSAKAVVEDPEPSTKSPAKSDPDTDSESDATKDDFERACQAAAIKFGSEHADVSRASVAKEITQLKAATDWWPTKADIITIVNRKFKEAADRSAAKAAPAKTQPRREKTSSRQTTRQSGRVVQTFDELRREVEADMRKTKTRK